MSYIPKFENPLSTLKKRVLLGFNQGDSNSFIDQPLNPRLISGFTTKTSVNFRGTEFKVDSSSSTINTDTLAITAGEATIDVSNNYTMTVGGDSQIDISGNQTMNVEQNYTSYIGGDSLIDISGNQTTDVSGNQITNVSGNVSLTSDGSQITNISGDVSLTSDGSQTTNISGDVSLTSNGNITITPSASGHVYVPGTFQATTVSQVNNSGTVYLLVPTATLIPYAGMDTSTPPTGWLFCNGSAYNATSSPIYNQLWLAIGTTYGGTGITNFNVPDMRDRVPVGYNVSTIGSGASARSARALNGSGGEETHALTINEMPNHDHLTSTASPAVSLTTVDVVGSVGGVNYSGGDTADGAAHNNMQPYLVVNYLIKY
jgi:microcystin-dependent protein